MQAHCHVVDTVRALLSVAIGCCCIIKLAWTKELSRSRPRAINPHGGILSIYIYDTPTTGGSRSSIRQHPIITFSFQHLQFIVSAQHEYFSVFPEGIVVCKPRKARIREDGPRGCP